MTLALVQNITRSIANSISLRTAWASFTAITAAVNSKRGTVTVRKGATRDFPSTNKHCTNPSEYCTRKFAQEDQ